MYTPCGIFVSYLARLRLDAPLRCKSNGDLELVTFSDKIPPYAVLSHTWVDEEVIFIELVTGTGKNKAGYDKTRFCGERAATGNHNITG